MNVISTVEWFMERGVFCGHFDLNAVMIQLVLLPDHRIDFCENSLLLSIHACLEFDMDSERVLIVVQ